MREELLFFISWIISLQTKHKNGFWTYTKNINIIIRLVERKKILYFIYIFFLCASRINDLIEMSNWIYYQLIKDTLIRITSTNWAIVNEERAPNSHFNCDGRYSTQTSNRKPFICVTFKLIKRYLMYKKKSFYLWKYNFCSHFSVINLLHSVIE